MMGSPYYYDVHFDPVLDVVFHDCMWSGTCCIQLVHQQVPPSDTPAAPQPVTQQQHHHQPSLALADSMAQQHSLSHAAISAGGAAVSSEDPSPTSPPLTPPPGQTARNSTQTTTQQQHQQQPARLREELPSTSRPTKVDIRSSHQHQQMQPQHRHHHYHLLHHHHHHHQQQQQQHSHQAGRRGHGHESRRDHHHLTGAGIRKHTARSISATASAASDSGDSGSVASQAGNNTTGAGCANGGNKSFAFAKKLRHREVEKNRHRQLQAMVKTISELIPGRIDKETQVQTMKRAARYSLYLRDVLNHGQPLSKDKLERLYLRSCENVDLMMASQAGESSSAESPLAVAAAPAPATAAATASP